MSGERAGGGRSEVGGRSSGRPSDRGFDARTPARFGPASESSTTHRGVRLDGHLLRGGAATMFAHCTSPPFVREHLSRRSPTVQGHVRSRSLQARWAGLSTAPLSLGSDPMLPIRAGCTSRTGRHRGSRACAPRPVLARMDALRRGSSAGGDAAVDHPGACSTNVCDARVPNGAVPDPAAGARPRGRTTTPRLGTVSSFLRQRCAARPGRTSRRAAPPPDRGSDRSPRARSPAPSPPRQGRSPCRGSMPCSA